MRHTMCGREVVRMAQVKIDVFRPDEKAKLEKRVSELEKELSKLESELRFALEHLDGKNFEPAVWKAIGGGNVNKE